MDKFEYINGSTIYHGHYNNRVYIMKATKNYEDVVNYSEEISKKNNYGKIIMKTTLNNGSKLRFKDYKIEAHIANFYKNNEDVVFLAKYLNKNREKTKDLMKINDVLEKAKCKKIVKNFKLPENLKIISLNKEHAEEMAIIYKKVFKSYPFDIFNPEYIKTTMDENIEYAGIMINGKLVSIASAEKDEHNKNAEMTDFATLPQNQGNGYAFYLLNYLEKKMKHQDYKTLYTIARAISYPMNITFKKSGYKHSGKLINNTNISGNIETMNVWYKHI